jgi:hypothetical protein
MGLLQSFFGGPPPPASAVVSLRETLFGDMPLDQWARDTAAEGTFPWSAFAKARAHLATGKRDSAVECWREVVRHPAMDTRHYLQAWHFLARHGHPPAPEVARRVLGVVVEVALPEGLDVLAAYADHTARYHGHAGSAAVWERPDTSLDAAIQELLRAASVTVAGLSPWAGERAPAPNPGYVHLSFLTPGGLHVVQAPWSELSRDPLAARVLQDATTLMTALLVNVDAT